MDTNRFRQAFKFAALLGLLFLAATPAWADPTWHQDVDTLRKLFDAKQVFAGMKVNLEYFQSIFTALGYGAVMISAVRKVAKARGGEESMGWVASMVMTVALMAAGPALGNQVFSACDEVAQARQRDGIDAVTTCWNALLIILPDESPVQEVLADASQESAPTKGAPVQKQDGAWTKLAWTWMKMAWSTMTNAFDKIGAALRAIANRALVLVLLFIPTVVLVCAMVLIQIGNFLREFLHQSMDVFLPMMIAMLSFEPMRGAASNYIIKYISVAFWPIAWALGNGLACAMLTSVMDWVVTVCRGTLQAINKAASDGGVTDGFLAGAAGALPWGLLHVLILVISLTALLIIASAIGAPLALTATMTKGACFARAQLQQAVSLASSIAAAPVSGGSSLALGAGSAGTAGLGASMFSSFATRASSSFSGAASRLAPMAAMGGPGGAVAAMGASALSRASSAVSAWAGGGSEGNAGEVVSNPPSSSGGGMSMMNTMPPLQLGISSGSSLPNLTASAPAKTAAAVARNFRRSATTIDG